jgi:hypothetical protein
MKESYKKYLTPEIMKDIMKMKSAEEIIKYAAEKNIQIDAPEAEKLLEKFAGAGNDSKSPLSAKELDGVAGGEECLPSSKKAKQS